MTKQPNRDPIPKGGSREALAEFWDTHSLADYRDELQPLQVHFSEQMLKRADDSPPKE
jgi:hypothetical protein